MDTREAVIRCFDMLMSQEVEEVSLKVSSGTIVKGVALPKFGGITITVK